MLSEQYRLAGIEWAHLDAAASLLEESKSAVLSQMVNHILENSGLAYNRAEMQAKSTLEWKEYITKMVKAREDANLAKINIEAIKMRHREEQSTEANTRAEMRL